MDLSYAAAKYPNVMLLTQLVSDGHCKMGLPRDMASIAPFRSARPARGRVEGMLLGLAAGNLLGAARGGGARAEAGGRPRPAASRGEAAIRAPAAGSRWPEATELAFRGLGEALESGAVDPDRLSRAFSGGAAYGADAFLPAVAGELPWDQAARESAGNGALARIAPLALPSMAQGGVPLVADLALGAMVTHNDSAAISSCVAFGLMLRDLLHADAPPRPSWWLESYVRYARPFETAKVYRPRGGFYSSFIGRVSDFVETMLPRTLSSGESVRVACDGWKSGSFLLETVPSGLYILALHGAEPREAMLRAAEDTGDGAAIAAIVGAAMGALHGKAGLPEDALGELAARAGSVAELFGRAAAAAERWGAADA